MSTEATYQLLARDEIARAIDRSFIAPVNASCLYALANSRHTADEIISAVREFDRSNSNRGDWATILHPILKNKGDVETLLAQF